MIKYGFIASISDLVRLGISEATLELHGLRFNQDDVKNHTKLNIAIIKGRLARIKKFNEEVTIIKATDYMNEVTFLNKLNNMYFELNVSNRTKNKRTIINKNEENVFIVSTNILNGNYIKVVLDEAGVIMLEGKVREGCIKFIMEMLSRPTDLTIQSFCDSTRVEMKKLLKKLKEGEKTG